MSSSNNPGQGSSSSPNKTTPPCEESQSRPRTMLTVVAASSPIPNRPQTVRPVTRPVISGLQSGQSSLLAFPRPQTSAERPLGMITPWQLAMGEGGPAGGSTGMGLQGPFGLYGVPSSAMGGPVGGVAGERLIGSGDHGGSASKKRGVDGEGASGGDGEIHRCTICHKTYGSIKALFGHLRSHPERGYKGAFPPPTFDAQVEFQDFPGANLPGLVQDDGGQAVMTDVQQVNVAQVEGEREEEVNPKPARVVDLNEPPPASDQ